MNPIPFLLRAFGGWQRIKAQLNDWAIRYSQVRYAEDPQRYRFSGWGLQGLPPQLACNVLYYPPSGNPINLGRFPGDPIDLGRFPK